MSVNAPSLTVRAPARSMGLKLLLVCALALLMGIPSLFVFFLLGERTQRATEVTAELSKLVGGPQTFLGPVLAVPYSIPAGPVAAGQTPAAPEVGTYVIFPKTGAGEAKLNTGVKRRGLFKAVTYTTDLTLSASFDLTKAGTGVPARATLDWSRAELLVGASDARGAQSDILLSRGAEVTPLAPAQSISNIAVGGRDTVDPGAYREPSGTQVQFFGAPARVTLGDKFDVTAKLKFSGAQRLAVLPFAETTTFKASGNWNGPSYDGGFIPSTHNGVDKAGNAKTLTHGFNAEWSVPYIARGVPNEGTAEVLSRLGSGSLGISLIEAANPYQAVERSLKYSLMFVGLVFLAYFLFETVQKRRVHPAQYVLIGLAQVIFYLLLLSIAERVGFDLGFLISATATVSLISAYAGWVFNSKKQGYVALASFTALYALIYILMRLEDWALLVGAVTSFGAIAAVMYFTRNLDWYGADAGKSPTAELKEGA